MLNVVLHQHKAWVLCASAVVILAVGCRRQDAVSGTQADKTIARTVFTERIENYFEYEPLTPGKPSSFRVHLTDLADGTAVDKADVTVLVRPEHQQGGTETKAKPGKVAGVYAADVTVPSAGRYTIEFRVKNPKLDERLVVDNVATGESASAALPASASGTVKFLMEQQWAVRMKLASAASATAARQITATGRVVPAARRHVVIAPPVSGILTGNALPRVGQPVARGDILLVVQQTPTSAETAQIAATQAQAQVDMVRLQAERRRLEEGVTEARVRRDHAKGELEREQALWEMRVIARRQLEAADATYRAAESSLAAAIAQRDALTAARIPDPARSASAATHAMTAPFSGTVIRVSKNPGERVAAGDPVLEILDASVVWIEVAIFESDLARLDKQTSAVFTTPAAPGKEYTGHLVDPGAVVSRETRTVTMVFEVPNPDRTLRIGLQANVRLDAGERAEVLVIPREAVQESEGKRFVYVLVSGEDFQHRDVTVGDEYGDQVAIVAGLKVGERVVTQGAYQLRQHELRPSAPGTHTHET